MYQLDLAESLIPAQEDDTVVETTVGDLLRKVARQHSQAPALVKWNPMARRTADGPTLNC